MSAYKQAGSLKAGFKPYTHHCRGLNHESLHTEKTYKEYVENSPLRFFAHCTGILK
jgi:hypothetical protein